MSEKSINTLSRQHTFQLATAIDAMRADIESGKMSAGMLIPIMEKKLGVTLTISNVKGAARACGVTLYRRRIDGKARNQWNVTRQLVDQQGEIIKALQSEVLYLKGLVEELATRPASSNGKFIMRDGRAVHVPK